MAYCLMCLTSGTLLAQDKAIKCSGFQDTLLHKFVYRDVDQFPEVEGGMERLYGKITKSIKCPPGEIYYSTKLQVAFVIERNGKIDGKRTITDPSGNKQIFSKQVFNIIEHLKWQPGRCNKKAVPVIYILPVNIDFEE